MLYFIMNNCQIDVLDQYSFINDEVFFFVVFKMTNQI